MKHKRGFRVDVRVMIVPYDITVPITEGRSTLEYERGYSDGILWRGPALDGAVRTAYTVAINNRKDK
jgi:hypothetical protein